MIVRFHSKISLLDTFSFILPEFELNINIYIKKKSCEHWKNGAKVGLIESCFLCGRLYFLSRPLRFSTPTKSINLLFNDSEWCTENTYCVGGVGGGVILGVRG